jgi:hypothetical protein
LLLNLSRWLLPETSLEQGQSLQAQQSFNLPVVPSASALIVETPDGGQLSIPADRPTFADTAEVGIYRVLEPGDGSTEPTLLAEFAVNLLAETETDLQAQTVQFTGSAPAPGQESLTGQREGWWLLALGGLAVLLAEWWVYWRGASR